MKTQQTVILIFVLSLISSSIANRKHIVKVAPDGELRYEPNYLDIKIGDTVTWVWEDSFHSVTQGLPGICARHPMGWDSGYQREKGFIWSIQFDTDKGYAPGDKIHYFCNVGIHCNQGMKGIISITR